MSEYIEYKIKIMRHEKVAELFWLCNKHVFHFNIRACLVHTCLLAELKKEGGEYDFNVKPDPFCTSHL